MQWLTLALWCGLSPELAAQSTATGATEGRVQNVATGANLNNARVAVKGSNLVTFTDEAGNFRLNGVPGGSTTLRVFFTGFDEQEIAVTVASGQTATQDVGLKSKSLYGTQDGTVKLDAFSVQSTRETSASAIAVNEQRFAGNITSVVSTDEFGTMVDSNPGEFLKYLPGIDVEYFANNITGVSVRGLGANNTEMNFDGMAVASMNAEAVGRGFEVQFATMSDIARAEIRKLPLPEDSSNAIGGTINLVRRSAFEYSKRQIRYQALLRSDGEELTFKDMDGPKDRGVPRWRPNWQVSWTEPVTKNFGFSFAIGQEDTVVNTHWSLPRWNFGSTANDTAAANAIAAGQPVPTVPSNFNPAMNNTLNHNAPLQQGKNYASVRLDWRPQRALTLGWLLSGNEGWKQVADDIRYVWHPSATGTGNVSRYNDATRTLGRPGGGSARQESPLWRDIYNPGISTVFDARWKQGPWELTGRAGWSVSRYQYYDTEHGFFNSTSVSGLTGLDNVPETGVGFGTANPIPLTLDFQHDYWGPKKIDAWTTATGAANYADRVAGKTTDTATNLGRASLAFTNAVYKAKGATNEGENANYFPSLHTSYNITENLVLQAGYAKTQGRINFQDALIPNNSISDDIITTGDAAGALGRITIQNPDLDPWTADNFEARISYYNRSGGVIGFGAFRKNVRNFQPQFDTPALNAQEIAAAAQQFPNAGIGPEHEGYSLRYRINSGCARLDGAEFEVRQSLNAFLPVWGRGFNVSGTTSYLNRKGQNGNELGVNRAWTNSANLHYRNRKFSGRFGYRMNGLQIENPRITSNAFVGRQVREAQHLIDINFEYSISKWARLFVSGQNMLNGLRVTEQRFAERPGANSLATSNSLGRTFTVGVSGEFGDVPLRWPWAR